MSNKHYLTDIPQSVSDYGFCKVLAVRHEVIHLKHIFTEIFVRNTIDIENKLKYLRMSLFDYNTYITNRLRHIHRFSRQYVIEDINEVVKSERDRFFPTQDLYKGLNQVVVLDFDGVVTSKKFEELYKLCIERNKVYICSANPTITEQYFEKRNLPIPHKIYSMGGKRKKIKQLLEIQKKHDIVFYVDNEVEYLEYAWIFGIKTFHYKNGLINYFSLNTR